MPGCIECRVIEFRVSVAPVCCTAINNAIIHNNVLNADKASVVTGDHLSAGRYGREQRHVLKRYFVITLEAVVAVLTIFSFL